MEGSTKGIGDIPAWCTEIPHIDFGPELPFLLIVKLIYANHHFSQLKIYFRHQGLSQVWGDHWEQRMPIGALWRVFQMLWPLHCASFKKVNFRHSLSAFLGEILKLKILTQEHWWVKRSRITCKRRNGNIVNSFILGKPRTSIQFFTFQLYIDFDSFDYQETFDIFRNVIALLGSTTDLGLEFDIKHKQVQKPKKKSYSKNAPGKKYYQKYLYLDGPGFNLHPTLP